MRKGFRCWLSVLLAAVLAMGLMPALALADENETGPVAVTSLAPSPQPEQHPVALDGPSPDELVAGYRRSVDGDDHGYHKHLDQACAAVQSFLQELA